MLLYKYWFFPFVSVKGYVEYWSMNIVSPDPGCGCVVETEQTFYKKMGGLLM